MASVLLDPRLCAEKRFHYLARDAVGGTQRVFLAGRASLGNGLVVETAY